MQRATMPLDRVPVASLDLQTTVLRARTDRIVQIGAIRSDDAVPPFAALVRPGVAIPVTSTRIHRIDDEMVAGADEFPMVLPRLRTQIGGHLILGGLRTENGKFNMKRHLSLPLVETLRVLAISCGITARSSAARAAALAAREDISPEVGRLGEDVAVVLRLVLRQQIADIAAGRQPGNGVNLKRLLATETGLVKSIAGHVERLDTLLKDTLFG